MAQQEQPIHTMEIQVKDMNTNAQINLTNLENSVNSQIRIQLNSTTSIGKKQQVKQKGKKVKKFRIIIDKFQQFIPQFLIFLNHQRLKSVIRLGPDYQLIIPRQPAFKYIHKNINHLKIWNGCRTGQKNNKAASSESNFDQQAMKKFKQNFGQYRTQEELCHLILQYKCSWDQVIQEFMKRKNQLRKYYFVKDRARV